MKKQRRPPGHRLADSYVFQPESLSKLAGWRQRRVEFMIRSVPTPLKTKSRQNAEVLGIGYCAPHTSLKAWAEIASSCAELRVVPQTHFFLFLFELIARYARFTNRIHFHKLGWRAECLKAMTRKLERENTGEGQWAREALTHFVSRLIEACIPPPSIAIELPLLKSYFDLEKEPLREIASKFLRTPLHLRSGSLGAIPEELWTLAHYVKRPKTRAGIPENLVETALWLDLKLQSELMSQALSEVKPNYDLLCSFLFHIGDLEWCRLADQRFDVFSWHRSLVTLRDARNAQLAHQKRRPEAARRRPDIVKLRGILTFVAPKGDIFKSALSPSQISLVR